MLNVPELNLGSVDAINYKTRGQKDFFSRILYREDYLNKILEKNKYFVIGEKGTGKTSYAVFLNNTDYQNTISRVISLTQTDYVKFIGLMDNSKGLNTSYVEIWKVILLLLLSDTIGKAFPELFTAHSEFSRLRDAIQEYYSNTFEPYVYKTLDLLEDTGRAADVMSRHADSTTDPSRDYKPSANIAFNLGYLERRFRAIISALKLDRDFILFIDGIDIRPDKIDYDPYIECIRGLANAVWDLNTEYFANIRDTKKHVKITLLMRPDILDNMGFQNLNAKVRGQWRSSELVDDIRRFQNLCAFQSCGRNDRQATGHSWEKQY